MAESARLLVVEDDPETASLLETYFQTQGYTVTCVRHGEEAEPTAAERRPDMILLDIRLPGMDGFEVARRLRANRRTSAIPILMLTDMHDREDRLKGLEVGAEDYIAKPFDLQELALRVRNAVDRGRRRRTTNPVTELPEGKPMEDAVQRMLLQPEWSLVTIRIIGLDAFRAGRGFPVADDLMRDLAGVLQSTAAERLKVGAVIGHLSQDELAVLSDQPSLFEFAKEVAGRLKQAAQTFSPLLPQAPAAGGPPDVVFHFRMLASGDGSYPTWDAVQNALEQTPPRTL